MNLQEKMGQKRREIAAQVEARNELLASQDELEAKLDGLLATEEQDNEAITAAQDEVKASYDALRKANDEIRAGEFELQELAEKVKARDEAMQAVELPEVRAPEADPQEDPEPVNARVLPATDEQLDHDIADYFRCSAMGGSNPFFMRQIAKELGNDRLYAAMTQSANPSILPDNYVPRMIELLRPRSVIRSLPGLRTPALLNGNMRLPRQATGASASYVGEQECFPLSTPTTEPLNLVARKLVASVVSSGELVRRSDPAADQMIRDDLIQTVATKEDITFIRSDGTGNSPTGLLSLINAGNQFAANAANTVASITSDLGAAILLLEASNAPMLNPVWIMHPRSARYIMDLRDGNGNMAFPEMARGELRGYPVRKTSQIPTNLGAGTNESEVYLVDGSECILADTPYFVVESSNVAAYDDGGTIKSTFSCDEIVWRIISEHDFQIRHDVSGAVINTVTWGA